MAGSMTIHVREQTDADADAIAGLMEATFGTEATQRSVWRLRQNPPVAGLCLVAETQGQIVGSLRFWFISLAGTRQLLLGPLAVRPDLQGKGVGQALVWQGLGIASQSRCSLCLVSGDKDYYPRFGFFPVREGSIIWPGEVAPHLLQVKELKANGYAALPPGPIAILHDPDPNPTLLAEKAG